MVTVLLTFHLAVLFSPRPAACAAPGEDAVPLTELETDDILGRVADTVDAIIFWHLIAAAVQGTLGGAMFWALGLPTGLLGIGDGVAGGCSGLGAFVVGFCPRLSGAERRRGKAAILTAWGAL